MVGLPAPNSHNVDHQVTYRAAFTALRPRPHNLKSFTPVVFVYDNFNLWNHEPFRANWFLNIENELDDKIHALSLYQSQMRAEPHERSLENLRRYHEVLGRGVGVSAVEQFELLRLFTE
jgi:LmbE family N-acetylglucosaminyl deacetylase